MSKKQFIDCGLLEVKVFEDTLDGYFTFEGYASTFGNKDHGSDVVVKGAFRDAIIELTKNAKAINGTDFVKLMPILWQHDWNNPIGSFIEMREDEKGLFVKGIMPKDDDFVKGRVIPQMKAGSVSDMSIGYMVKEDRYDRDEKIRYIEKAGLFETSLVTIPMNNQAHVTAMKAAVFQELPIADKETEFDHDLAQKRHTDKGVDEKAYLVINKKDNGAEYLLPIADFVNEKLMVIPKAVFYAAFVVHKGDILEGMQAKEVSELKENIEKYYKSMGMNSPFIENGAFRVDDEKTLTERELETLLKSGVCFSQKMSKALVKLLNDDAQRDVDVKSQRDAELKGQLEKLLNTL